MIVRNSLRKWIVRDPQRYDGLRADLISARSGMTLDQYLWRSAKITLVAAFFFALMGYLIISLFGLQIPNGKIGIYNVFNLQLPVFFNAIYPSEYVLAILIIVSLFIGAYIGYSLMLRLPAMEKRNRSIKINLTLHNAVAYMYAMRRGGAQLMIIFRSLSDRASIYGEVALEFRQIVRDADFFGYDVVTAIHHLSDTTPSAKLKIFLEDLLSIIESGGDMTDFLSMRVRVYQEEAKLEQKQFLNVLSLVAESYVTLFVAGPLFLIIIMVVMGMMGGSAVLQLAILTYAIIPIGSVVFILVLDLISIKAEKSERYTKVKWLHTFSEVTIVKKVDESQQYAQIKKYDQLRDLIYYLKHPFENFVTNVDHTLYVTVPVALIYIGVVFLNIPRYRSQELFISVIDDHIVIALLIVLVPYAIFYAIWSRKVMGIQSLMPDFLERMAGINQVGLTIAQAIAIMVNTNLGLLSYEIRKIKRDMEWRANFTEALMRFEERVSTPSIARTVTLITKASEMSGQISVVLSIAAGDAKMTEVLKKERLIEMFIYTAIVYLSFFVFLFVVGVMATQFLPVLANITTTGIPQVGAMSGIGSIPIQTINRILYHACLIQALFSGIIAGQMSEVALEAGIKHSCVLIIITLVIFNFVLVI